MDEPCSALDPIATAKIEDLMEELKRDHTIVIVTHSMQQAARVSDRTAFFTAESDPDTVQRTGVLVERNPTTRIFSNPADPRTGLHHRPLQLSVSGPASAGRRRRPAGLPARAACR